MADRRVIQLLFKIGKCLAFTPFSLTGSKPSRFQKIYKSAILTLYTAVTIYTWYTRMIFYVDLTKIQLVLKVLIDVNVYAHNFYTLVVVKQEHWFTLMCCLANIDNQAKQDSYLLTALVPLVTVGGVIITELCYWYYSFGWYSLCFFFFEVVHNYCQFFYNVLTGVILKMILARYKYQTVLARSQVHLSRLRRNFHELTCAIRVFNDVFGWVILLNICVVIPKIMVCIHYLIRGSRTTFKHKSQYFFLLQNIELGLNMVSF
jgi:hypothetical protein